MSRVLGNGLAFAAPVALLAGSAHADLPCAPAGVAHCGGASDMATISTPTFAQQLAEAGANVFIFQEPGAQALEEIIGAHVLSPKCLACQGAALECSTQQTQCFEACAVQGSCSRECMRCAMQSCAVDKACGGVAGQTLQLPYTCSNPSDPTSLAVDKSLLNLPFTGHCSGAAAFEADSINIPIRPRDADGNMTMGDKAADASMDSINIPIRPRAEETKESVGAKSINIPIRHRRPRFRGQSVAASAANETVQAQAMVSAEMHCAPAGAALCGSSSDMNLIDNVHFAGLLSAAATEVFINQIPGSQALASTMGKGLLSQQCLSCQGAALDCAVQQSQCFELCAVNSCSAECRSCIQEKCDARKACGGVAGVSIQQPYTCYANDPTKFYVNKQLLNVPFTGVCNRRLLAENNAEVMV